MFLFAVCEIMKLDYSKVFKTIENFKPLEHRLEYVGRFKNIDFYNDSIATIPEATINACETINNLGTLIFGGQDRGIDYDKFVEYLNDSNINNFICMPTTGHMLGKRINEVTIKQREDK